MSKKIVFLGVLGLTLLGSVWVYSRKSDNNPKPAINSSNIVNSNKQSETTQSSELIIGNPNAKFTVIEYADFKCPECGKFHSDSGKKLKKDYIDTGKIKILFRPFPISSEDGAQALIGSYCANQQGKFNQYYDKLFDYMWQNHFKQGDYQKMIDPVFTDDLIKTILQEIDIDQAKYFECRQSPQTKEIYLADVFKASPDEVQGTPTYIIGDQKIVGNQPYQIFKTLLDVKLSENQ